MRSRWIAWLALGGALALPVLAQPRVQDPPPVEDPKPKKLEVGSTVDETLMLVDLDGKRTTFKQFRDKVVILHFWSDRCPAEKHGDPVTKGLEGYYAGKDVVIVGIASNQGELGEQPPKDADYSKFYGNLRKKIAEVGFKHAIYADHGNVLSDLFQARSTPHCFVVDQKGVLRYAGALDDDPSEKKGDKATVYVRDAADALLAGEDVKVKTTKPYG